MAAVADGLEAAKEEIFITDWWSVTGFVLLAAFASLPLLNFQR